MGADAEIIVFDYDRYRSQVVPALVEMIRGRGVEPWLAEVFRSAGGYEAGWRRLAEELRTRSTDLARYCTWLADDLRYIGADPVDREAGKQVFCHALSCPERLRCRFHADNDRFALEELNALHEALVATLCLGQSRFLGRSVTPGLYLPVFRRCGVPEGDPLWDLLGALATRGAAFGYQYTMGTDGIHGWLTPAEAGEMARRLGELPLTGADWPEESLSRIRVMAAKASAAGFGVLWGNDVMPDMWAQTFGMVPPVQ
ncbi:MULTISPECIES: hypothetical protein [Actinoplanes]|uniref:hypothetical protein n=1 Tax=Actinoplanes TaxID=1865 RepID=UPI0005F27952|nr:MULTISPECIES: hypothetical protein [Actinoplanes]GLY02593.1 hypothetical protein Acsp01_29720 [Actinoplanes sp. NBRC 101535]